MNLLYYFHTLSMIEIIDLNDDQFYRYGMNIKYVMNNNKDKNNNNNDNDDDEYKYRIFNRCYCSYYLEPNMLYFPSN